MKLVINWQSAWKWASMRVAAVGIALQAAILAFPGVKDWLGDTVTHLVGLALLVGIVASRLVAQPNA